MPAATKESRKYVEGVMVSSSATLLPLFETFVSVLIVDLAGFGDRESFVCFCYFDEFLFGSLIASARLIRKSNLSIWNDDHTDSYQDGISCSMFGTRA
jgi:hypothetical protein